ncbi:hypothetical protein AAS21_gp131 [Pantoea phage vB_PagS_AAS21]|uniref:I-spanin n=1 Tax=Pantoea phage vB_PagS_AAS21 TaxID=2575261 RepID=A0A4Y5P1N9_9CAUD|nr:hypothetical protein AAS21_gp131 [Pantoea phage vB_PagS_AAS21]
MPIWFLTFWKTNKTAIILFLLVAVVVGWIYFTVHGLNSNLASTKRDLETTKTELAQANGKIVDITTKYNDLRTLAIENQARINGYYGQLQQQALLYQNTLKQLDILRKSEKDAVKNPSKAAQDLQKQFNDSEREVACLTGNLQFCSPQ